VIDVGVELRCYGAWRVYVDDLQDKIVLHGDPPLSVQAKCEMPDDSAPLVWVHSFKDDSGDVLVSYVGEEATFYRMPGWVFSRFVLDNGCKLSPINHLRQFVEAAKPR
jgi:hypothetical protein